MRLCIFGALDHTYARNHVLRLGLRRLGVRVQICAAPPWRAAVPRYAALLWRYARLQSADALLVPEFRHKDVPLARLLASVAGIPLIVDPLISRYDTRVHDWGSARPGSWAADHSRREDRAALRFADLVLCDTRAHAAYFQRAYRVAATRCRVVPVGFDDSVFRPQPEPPARPFRIAFFGSFLPLHGIETILAAAWLLRPAGVRLLLVGEGQTFDQVTRAERDGLMIERSSSLAPRALSRRLATAHVLLGIFGTSDKAQRVVPNKVYQSLALGRAVITSDSPAIRDACEPGVHLVTVPAGDPQALANAVLALRDDPERRARLAAAGGHLVHTAFNPEAIARRFLSAVREVLGTELEGRAAADLVPAEG